jgi:hypothetical protein
MTRIDGRGLRFMGQGPNMELLRQTRFEQIPLAAVLKIVKEQARLSKIKIAKVLLKRCGGAK